jgi:hypothetical protein
VVPYLKLIVVTVGTKGEEVTGGWRRIRNKEVLNFYASQNIIRVVKSRRMGR